MTTYCFYINWQKILSTKKNTITLFLIEIYGRATYKRTLVIHLKGSREAGHILELEASQSHKGKQNKTKKKVQLSIALMGNHSWVNMRKPRRAQGKTCMGHKGRQRLETRLPRRVPGLVGWHHQLLCSNTFFLFFLTLRKAMQAEALRYRLDIQLQ